MKKQAILWIIPAVFFAVCCIVHLYGIFVGSAAVARCTKPALMPLLCLATVTALLGAENLDRRKATLLMLAQLFGFVGDVFLIYGGSLFLLLGLVMFLVGHIFYISLFGGISWKGMKAWQWAVGLAVCATVAAGIVKVLGIRGNLMAPMAVYAMASTLLMFSAFAGVLRRGGALWWLLFIGTVIFTFSDTLIAAGTFIGLNHFMSGFMVMLTYLIAQSILAIAGCRLICGED